MVLLKGVDHRVYGYLYPVMNAADAARVGAADLHRSSKEGYASVGIEIRGPAAGIDNADRRAQEWIVCVG